MNDENLAINWGNIVVDGYRNLHDYSLHEK